MDSNNKSFIQLTMEIQRSITVRKEENRNGTEWSEEEERNEVKWSERINSESNLNQSCHQHVRNIHPNNIPHTIE